MLDNGKVLVGMSGGVDSSAAVCLLQEQGYTVLGGTLLLTEGACAGEDNVRDAKAVAEKMGIPHSTHQAPEVFCRQVMDYFAESYERGLTPNPCIQCNRYAKIPLLLEMADQQGAWYAATGHYARIQRQGDRFLLKKGADVQKDQSYFLYALTQTQLSRLLFPLGGLSKQQVRMLAEEHRLSTAGKRDSQDICFIPDGDYAAFLQRHTGRSCPPGSFVDVKGNILGRHEGHIRYTLGQRRGLKIALGQRTYVVGKDPEKNTVTLGGNEDLMTVSVTAKGLNFLACDRLEQPVRLEAKTRYSQRQSECIAVQTDEDTLTVSFTQPQRAAAPGQALVLYDGDTVVCGGTIV